MAVMKTTEHESTERQKPGDPPRPAPEPYKPGQSNSAPAPPADTK
jgi:hypothetical protein